VHADVEALLALQAEDQAIHVLEERLAAFAPRLSVLDDTHRAATEALVRAQAAVEIEERRQRELHAQIAKHKQLHERNLAQLDLVKRMRDATAAMAQVEAARRMLAEEESELQAVTRRLTELRAVAETQTRGLAELETQHAAERHEIDAARGELQTTLGSARAERARWRARSAARALVREL
jgi:predicted  nucleic acid-binding Zn-ribbon protein